MRVLTRISLVLAAALSTFGCFCITTKISNTDKPRIVVLTDIAPGSIEPDDMESMIRLLAHADLFEIEALITTSGWNSSGGEYPVGWMDSLSVCLNAYEKDLPKLMKRSEQKSFKALNKENKSQQIGYWPSPEYLRSRVRLGSLGMGTEILGDNNRSAGSDFIIELLQEKDERPLWVLAWGGANTLSQAVWQMQRQFEEDEFNTLLGKLRLYTITDQDVSWGERWNHKISSHHWLRKEFGERLFHIWDESAWLSQNDLGSGNWKEYAEHIQNHGNLGSIYPKNKYGVEGDTPSYLHVMPTGLNNPSEFDQVGWGGFFKWGMSADRETECYTNFDPEIKKVSQKYEEYFYPTVFNNFAARMDWAKDGKGNRNPVVIVGRDKSLEILHISGKAGKQMKLNASRTYDPDGDGLSYKWWVLPEAGTYNGTVSIENADTHTAVITVPADLGERTIHLILEVTDKGNPALTSYRRIIITE